MADFDLTESRVSTRDNYPAVGCQDVMTPKGPVHLHDAPGALTMLITHQDGERSVGLLVYDPGAPVVQGLLAQVSPGTARVLAESLLHLAAEIDGGRMDS